MGCMHPDDQKRLDRALSIWRATRGGDYSMLEKSISNAKGDQAKQKAAQDEDDQRRRYGLKKKRERGEDKLAP